jgi:putative MATE family efflux protein
VSAPVDPTRGPLLPALLRLTAPVVVMQLCHTLFHFVDVMWVGRLGPTATAAVTTSFYVVWAVFSFADIAGVAVAATVSRHIGAGDRAAAGYGAAQALWLAVGLGVACAAGGLVVVRPILAAIGAAPDVQELALEYLVVVLLGAPAATLYVTGESTLRAAGDTKTPMWVIGASLALNAVLAPLLIFGPGPLPALGVRGAAIATVFAQSLVVVAFLRLAWRGHPAFPLDRAALRRPAPRYMASLARIGAPFAAIGLLFSFVYLVLATISARFGTSALAILGIGNRIESLCYLVAVAFGLATETMVGQNLGARDAARAERSAWLACAIMTSLALALGAVMAVWPETFLRFFTDDPATIALGVPYVRVLAVCQGFMAVELVLNGAFSGAGDTMPPMIISVTISLLRVPMAWALALGAGWGMLGVAWTITLTCVARAVLLAWWFRRGRWKTKRLASAATHPLPAPDPAM